MKKQTPEDDLDARMEARRNAVALRVVPMSEIEPEAPDECLKRVGFSNSKDSSLVAKSATNSQAFVRHLATFGVGPQLIAFLISEGLDAKIPIIRKGQVVINPKTNEPLVQIDHQVRLAYIDRAMKMLAAEHRGSEDTGPKLSPIFYTLIQKFDSMPVERKQRFAVDGDFTVLMEDIDGNGHN